jgi:outer membrane protein TolC
MALSGCASVNFEDSVAQTNKDLAAFTQGHLELAGSNEQRAQLLAKANELLANPLSQAGATQLALVNSPSLQALLSQNWADAAGVAQYGRISNPTLSFERSTLLDEVELNRRLSFGLLDLLTLPLRYQSSQRAMAKARIQLASDVVDQVTLVRQAWVQAVAAQQNLALARQVSDLAQASAEMAKRMQAAGNFSKLDRLRHQALYADAASQLAVSSIEANASREALIRALGLTQEQSAHLILPERLPDLPKSPREATEVSANAVGNRLDVGLAQANWEAMGKSRSAEWMSTFTDAEFAVRRDTVSNSADGSNNSRQGYEIAIKLPLFDWGGMRREALDAQTLAAGNRLEATLRIASSNLRESYVAYRTSYDIAMHFRTEVLPLHKAISEENVLRYNGMFIGVFDLLADAREQASTVMAAINAEKQFWLADATLQSTVIGRPINTGSQP